MMNLIKKLVKDESGQDMAEYGIALAVITVAVGAIAAALGGNVKTIWQNAQTTIATIAG
jgi:pilus assembly protein Flp/PilA